MSRLHKIQAPVMFNGTQALENQVLLLREDGIIEAVMSADSGLEDVQVLREGWLCPGFVNAHCHLELSHLQGFIPPGSGMVPFLMQVMSGRNHGVEQAQEKMQQAILQMESGGIVAVGDICNTTLSVKAKQESSMYWHHFVEVSGFVPQGAEHRFRQALETRDAFSTAFHPDQVSLVPHAPYSVSPALFGLLGGLSQSVTTMHHQESLAEMEFISSGSGPMLALFEAIGVDLNFYTPYGPDAMVQMAQLLPAASSTILVHNCYTSRRHIELLKDHFSRLLSTLSWCLCPLANRYIGNALPDVPMMVQEGLHICLGTDSLASNQRLSLLAEMQELQQAYAALSAEQLLHWATASGARALNIQERFGSFKPGMQPGVLWLKNMDASGSLSSVTIERLY